MSIVVPNDASQQLGKALREIERRLSALEKAKPASLRSVELRPADPKHPVSFDVEGLFRASGPAHALGYVPDPGSSAGTSRFLREDATWVEPFAIYNPSTMTVVAGTLDTGAVGDVATIGATAVAVSEVSATPGWHIVFDWTGVVGTPKAGNVIARYSGGANHAPVIAVYDYVAVGWVTVETLVDAVGMHCYAFPLNGRFVSGGAMSLRFYHAAAGNVTHDMFIDYVGITAWRV